MWICASATGMKRKCVSSLGDWIDRLFNKHKAVRRGLVVWAVWLITVVTLLVFSDLDKLTAPVATALATITALLTVVVGLYQWSRNKDGEK